MEYILLQYNGEWDEEHTFRNFKVDGVLVPQSCSFATLLAEINRHLNLGSPLDIKYSLKPAYPPMSVHNDSSLLFYIQMKKSNPDITQYPLCINVVQSSSSDIASVSSTTHTLVSALDVAQNEFNILDVYVPQGIEVLESLEANPIEELNIIEDPQHQEILEDQVYKDKKTLSDALKNYTMQKGCQFRVDRSSSTRYSAFCINDGCKWMLLATSVGKCDLFRIRKFEDTHTCPPEERLLTKRHASTEVIARLIMDKFQDPKRVYTPNDIIADMKKQFGIDLNYQKAWRCKEKATELMRGDPTASYGLIPSYFHMLEKTNPGTVTRLKVDENNRFRFCFVALAAAIAGWRFCKPTVVVDAAFLKSKHKGAMIISCTQDADGHIFPLAYGIVDSENDESWEWFFQQFKQTFGRRMDMSFVSDRHESIIKAASTVYSGVPHYVCIVHLWNNVKKHHKTTSKDMKELFFSLARAYTIPRFDHLMKEMRKLDPNVEKFLTEVGLERWSRAHAPVKRGMIMTSNIAESINAANKAARELPVLRLLETMEGISSKWIEKNKETANGTFSDLSTKYHEMLRENTTASHYLTVKPSADFIYAVNEGETRNVVCLKNKTCTCLRFQIDEIPCKHAVAVLTYNNTPHKLLVKYCSAFYTTKCFKKTYEVPIYPMVDDKSWDVPEEVRSIEVKAPIKKVMPGRPKKSRYTAFWEKQGKKQKITCGLCHQTGHNRKTCRNPTEQS